MRVRITTLALLAALALPGSALAGAPRTARFTVTVTGAQTTKWDSHSGTYTDCNGTSQTHGEGTDVYRFDSGRPQRLLVTQNMFGAVNFQTGTWDSYKLESAVGLLSDARLTRHGLIEHTWTGGYCGHPPTTNTGPYDCGQRHGIVDVIVEPVGDRRRVSVQVVNPSTWKPFSNCPISTPAGVSDFGFTTTYGRLSNKLLFGKQPRIVVEDGKVYRRSEGATGTNATSTTHIRIVLVRHR
jgi:hypothetical protein